MSLWQSHLLGRMEVSSGNCCLPNSSTRGLLSSVKNGTAPRKLTISQSEPEQGCGDNSHHIFRTNAGIPLEGLPRLSGSSPARNDESDKPKEILKVDAGVSPPRLIRQVE